MATENIIDGSSSITANTVGATIPLSNWATLGRGVVPCQLWVYAATATVGDTGQVILYNSSGSALITVDIDNGSGWYFASGNLPASTMKYDMYFGNNTTGVLAVSNFSLFPLIEP